MEIVLAILVTYIVLRLFSRLLNRLTSSVVKSASSTATKLRALRLLVKRLPEGKLLNIFDRRIKETGEAMLLDGASTQEVNLAMLEMLVEKHSSKPTLLLDYPSLALNIPGF